MPCLGGGWISGSSDFHLCWNMDVDRDPGEPALALVPVVDDGPDVSAASEQQAPFMDEDR